MNNQVVANMLLDIANIKSAKGANKFSVGSYRKAAKFITHLTQPITELDYQNQKGIGPKIAASIEEFLSTGKVQWIEDNKDHLQANTKIEELVKVEGIGEKTALKIHEALGITTIVELKAVIEDGSISQVMKPKSIEKVVKGLEYLEKTKGRLRLDTALILAMQIHECIKPHCKRIEVCGSIRRSKETVGDVDFAIIPKVDASTTLRAFEAMPMVDKVIDSGDKKSSVWINGVRCDAYVWDEDVFESGMMHLTGSDEHNKYLRILAIRKGWMLSQYGIYRRGEDDKRTGDRLDDGTEKGIYKMLGLEFVPPEHREGPQEIDRYVLGSVVPIIKESDITQDLHAHSTWSDGSSSIEDMVAAAKALGLKAIAICDHSQSLKIAKGLTPDRLRERNKLIDELRKSCCDFSILKGSEVEIRSDGTLDYPDDILDELDVVVAARHNQIDDATEAYVKAIQSGKVNIIAHITNRIIGKRAGHNLNIERVLKECALHNVAIELNCQPDRLDADSYVLQRCKTLGVKISFASDAHHKGAINYVKTFGLWIGRRGWISKDDIYIAQEKQS